MPSAVNISLPGLIQQQALASGVPPAIALAVAQQESGVSQWTASGNLVTGSSGEIGVFQLMPATAAGLGVDPTDVNQNISGGISLLAQLYAKFGNWSQALSAYNSGSPSGSPSYAASVLNLAGGDPDAADNGSGSDLGTVSAPSGVSGAVIVGAILGAVALAWWALD
jgi:soluble lytic murein transglycosylase-like protein